MASDGRNVIVCCGRIHLLWVLLSEIVKMSRPGPLRKLDKELTLTTVAFSVLVSTATSLMVAAPTSVKKKV